MYKFDLCTFKYNILLRDKIFISILFLLHVQLAQSAEHDILPSVSSLERTEQIKLFQYNFSQNPHYANDFARRLNAVIKLFHDIVRSDIYQRTQACLEFPFQILEEPYNQTLEKVITELIPLYFNSEGMLITLEPDDIPQRNAIIAQLLKNDLEYSNYVRLLRIFDFKDILKQEERTGTYIWNGICHVVTGGWLPTFYTYPQDIKHRIKTHPGNYLIRRINELCAQHAFDEAQAILTQNPHALCESLYKECYLAYRTAYCDECGILITFMHDPIYSHLLENDKKLLAVNVYASTTLNKALAARALKKESLHEQWDIPHKTSECVESALYTLIDSMDTDTLLMSTLEEIMEANPQNYTELYRAFYLPNGIMKLFKDCGDVQSYNFDASLCDDLLVLHEVNTLFYLSHEQPVTLDGTSARLKLAHLEYIQTYASFAQPRYIEFDLEALLSRTFTQRITHNASDIMHGVRDYTYNTIKKLLAFIYLLDDDNISP